MGDGNERTDDENSSRRERFETADGRRNPGHRKGSASRREDILQGRGGHNRNRIYLALEARPHDSRRSAGLTSASPSFAVERRYPPKSRSTPDIGESYSITSPARMSNVGRMSRPIALAALGLIASTRRSPATRRRYCPAACTRPGRSGSVRRDWSCQIHQSYGAVWG
jgi:hypothetical protein